MLDDGSLYHICADSVIDWFMYYDLLVYQYNGQIYYIFLNSNHQIFNDFYNVKPIKANNKDYPFDITINGIIINKYLQLHPYCCDPETITYYIQHNQHLLDVEPYILK